MVTDERFKPYERRKSMTDTKKGKRKDIQALKKAHDQRAVLITKVDNAQEKLKSAQAKLEKRTRKLQSIEARIAELTTSVYGMPAPSSAPVAEGTDGSAASDNTPKLVKELPDDPAASA
jgi:hypothetical protein